MPITLFFKMDYQSKLLRALCEPALNSSVHVRMHTVHTGTVMDKVKR